MTLLALIILEIYLIKILMPKFAKDNNSNQLSIRYYLTKCEAHSMQAAILLILLRWLRFANPNFQEKSNFCEMWSKPADNWSFVNVAAACSKEKRTTLWDFEKKLFSDQMCCFLRVLRNTAIFWPNFPSLKGPKAPSQYWKKFPEPQYSSSTCRKYGALQCMYWYFINV